MKQGKVSRNIGPVLIDCLIVLFVLFTANRATAGKGGIDAVAVIAHSLSTSMKAREIRANARWVEVSAKEADHVLVVCRSALFNPLDYSYDCYCDLDEDAENQFNISGSNYHIYLYQINDDLSVSQTSHNSFEADD